jgi:kumamolisin
VLAPGLGPLLSSSRSLGPLGSATLLHLSLGLGGRDTGALDGLLDQGQTVPTTEYDNRFGPDPRLVAATEKWLRAGGLEASWSPGDAVLEVQGSAGAVEKAFSVSLGRYRAAGGGGRQLTFYAPGGRPTLPVGAAKVVTSVLGLDDYPVLAAPRPALGGARSAGGTNCPGAADPQAVGGFSPDEVAGFYNFGPLYKGGLSGAGQTVVFMEVDGFLPSDIQAYSSAFGLPSPDITGPIFSRTWDTPAAISFGTFGCLSETDLDLQVVHGMAPEAHLVVYQAEADQQGPPLTYVADALQAAINNYPRSVFNLSLLWCEDAASAQQFEGLFAQLVSGGGTAFVSSGDNGAYARGCPGHNLSTQEPADTPHAVGVGATTALIGAGSTYGREASWGEPFEQWGTGGGLSAVFKRPIWQSGPGVLNQYSNGMRQIPDVSALGDLDTGWDIAIDGKWQMVGGTSAAAPLWAALTALTDEALAQHHLGEVGFANPAFYDFGSHPSHFPAPAFHPVTAGTNLYYPATSSGWNYGTGWGTPNAPAVVDDFIAYERGAR